jgi:type I restriction enzyme, S subunit
MASEWRESSLGEVVELKRGYDLPQQDRQPGNIAIISSSGPTGFHNEA